MLGKPWSLCEEFWDAEHCRLSFALPKEPRGRGLLQCHLCLWLWWVTVSGCVGGYREDQFITVSLEDGRCAEVSGQIVVWKLGLETVKITQCKEMKGDALLVWGAQYGQPVVQFAFAKRNIYLCCGAPLCQHAGGRWFTAHPRGENISLVWGCRTDAVREEKRGVLVEQLNIPVLFNSQQLSSPSTAFPPLLPVLLPFSKRVCEKAEWIFLFKAFLESLMLHIQLCHYVLSKIRYKQQTVFLTKPTLNLKSGNDIIIPFNSLFVLLSLLRQ